MLLLSMRGIKKSFGMAEILKGIDLDIHEGERIGLVGRNGAGKTTLINILFGNLPADAGVVLVNCKELTVGYLTQTALYHANTLKEKTAESGVTSESGDFMEFAGKLCLDRTVELKEDRDVPLSGGERTKLAIARIWTMRPDLLILDEPTNHMDFQGVAWLIDEIRKYKGTVLTVSHDRYFLDLIVNRIVEIENGKAANYHGNYTCYRNEKKRLYDEQMHRYLEQKKQEKKIEEEMERLRQWSAKAHREAGKGAENKKGAKEYFRVKAKKMDIQVKSRMKRLEKMQREGEKKPQKEENVYFNFDGAEKRGKRMVEAYDIGKSFGTRQLFAGSSFYLLRGEKVGLIGGNGSGKTTLIRMMMGEEEADQGKIRVSPSVRIAYIKQGITDLKPEHTLMSFLSQGNKAMVTRARILLNNMGFGEDMLVKKFGQMSPGERTRIKITAAILENADFLILDEPTNHLDLPSRERLEETLEEYKGTILLVSHDRYMLERLTNRLLVIEDGRIRRLEYGFGEFGSHTGEPRKNEAAVLEDKKQEKLILENKLAGIIGRLSSLAPGNPEYELLDQEYKSLVERIRELG